MEKIKNLNSLDLLKLVTLSYAGIMYPIVLIGAFLSLFGVTPANFNDEKVYGITGFFVYLIGGGFLVAFISLILWIFFLVGLKISLFFIGLFKKDKNNTPLVK